MVIMLNQGVCNDIALFVALSPGLPMEGGIHCMRMCRNYSDFESSNYVQILPSILAL